MNDYLSDCLTSVTVCDYFKCLTFVIVSDYLSDYLTENDLELGKKTFWTRLMRQEFYFLMDRNEKPKQFFTKNEEKAWTRDLTGVVCACHFARL